MHAVLKLDMAFAKWKAICEEASSLFGHARWYANSHVTDYLWGSFTIFFGIVFYFVVPNDQASAVFLNKREKYVAVERLRENQAVVENPHFQWYQAREALTDPRCLLMIPLAFLNVIPNACVSTFSPIVLRGMGYTPLETIIMVSPGGNRCIPSVSYARLFRLYPRVLSTSLLSLDTASYSNDSGIRASSFSSYR